MVTKIQEDIKDAMRSKNTDKLNVLRTLKNEITNTALRKGSVNEVVSELEIMQLIRKEVSKRQDSIKAFDGRQDLIDKEQAEISILSQYLPVDMSDEDLAKHVSASCEATGATSMKDMGKVIKDVVERVNGQADNKRISLAVKGFIENWLDKSILLAKIDA